MRLHLISVANVSVATSTTNINVPLPEGQRCWRLHGDPHIWRLLWSFHLLDALSAEPGPEQSSAGLLLPLGCLCNDWWVTFCFFFNSRVFKVSYTMISQPLSHQAPSSCGCSGPASTRPSRTTGTGSTEPPSTPTWLWPRLCSPLWPSRASSRSTAS